MYVYFVEHDRTREKSKKIELFFIKRKRGNGGSNIVGDNARQRTL